MDEKIIYLANIRTEKRHRGVDCLRYAIHNVLDEIVGAIAEEHFLPREEAHLIACRAIMSAMLIGVTDSTRPKLVNDLRAFANALNKRR